MLHVGELNRILAAGHVRAGELEPRLAALLEPILNRAGDEAARGFLATVTDYLTASGPLVAAAPSAGATMVAVKPRPEEAAALAEAGGEDAGTLHVTLAFLGDTEESAVPLVVEALKPIAAAFGPLVGKVGGVGIFDDNGNGNPAILLPDVPGLVELRQAVCEALCAAQIDYGRDHGWTAHVTIRYGDAALPTDTSIGLPLHFDDLVVARGDVPYPLPLVGVRAVTAAAPPKWGAPAPDELVDVDKLVKTLRTKTDPVRVAFVQAVMGHVLDAAEVSWDVSNPFAAGALAETGAQITHIAETTRLNVMRIIGKAYEEGLSIPDTAKAIRAGMKAATPARATLIARTEMARAVNSASLASVQILSAATGQGYRKQWMTAPGARHPRHETYVGLDGQTVPLNAYFDVGGANMLYPADPSGPASESANCRCALGMVEGGSGAASISEDISL